MNENNLPGMTRQERVRQYEINTILSNDSTETVEQLLQSGKSDEAKIGLASQWELFSRNFPQQLSEAVNSTYQVDDQIETSTFSQILEKQGWETGSRSILQILKQAKQTILDNH